VRTLAPAMSPEFEQRLRERIEARAARPPRRFPRLGVHSAPARFRAWLGFGVRPRALALGGICAMAAVIVLVIAAPWQVSEPGSSSSARSGRVDAFTPSAGPIKAPAQTDSSTGASAAGAQPSSAAAPPAAGGSPPARVQQLAASITLAPKPEAVQSVADEVTQLAVREGGFVQSSQVRLQRGAGGSAELRLSLPSARLSPALASLGRLAPTRAESQSLQDITGEYDAARGKLSDAVAERQALLRALARATTQGEIESLHARLALAAAAVTRARSAFAAISERGSDSTVEVTVLGDAHAGAARSTLSDGLHDALDVLKGVAVVLLVALAVLVPLALLLVLAALGWRSSRRHLRERALS
jgi:hypothetical protein